MKYELTTETKEDYGVTLYRIKYLETGELGGWIESEKNLSQDGNARVIGDALVCGNAQVFGNALVCGEAHVCGEAQVCGNAWVFDKARVIGDALVCGNAQVFGNALVCGNARVCGGAWESSPLQIQGTRFFFTVSSEDGITVGCQTKTVAEWQASYEEEFDGHGFTPEQRLEYKLYFNLASRLYGWGVTLPI